MGDQTNEQLKATLWKLATGYEVTEKEAVRGKDGKEDKVRIRTRHVPPNIDAITQVQRLITMGEWEV